MCDTFSNLLSLAMLLDLLNYICNNILIFTDFVILLEVVQGNKLCIKVIIPYP